MTAIAKALDDELARLDGLLSRQEAVVRRAFADFVATVKSEEVVRAAADLLEANDINGALDMVDGFVAKMGTTIPQVYIAVGQAEAVAMAPQIAALNPLVGVTFDPTNPRAAALLREAGLTFIRGFSDEQRAATQQALSRALLNGGGIQDMVRAFRDSLGLTRAQEAAVQHFADLLTESNAEALQRTLRDRRFDPTVRRASRPGAEPLTQDQVQRMVDAYRRRYLAYRGETIARTESLTAVARARRETFRQQLDALGLRPDEAERVWRSVHDARTRWTHRDMDGQRRGMDEPYKSPSGATLMFPGDPAAPAEERVNCRCVETFRIKA